MSERSPFLKDVDVRWCPGCGDYAVLKYLADTLAEKGLAPHDVTVVSGIGCSSRMPYYLNSYGFHTLHGRALSVATGIALTQPERPLIVITGDGDSCSIGLSHFLHTIRRNVKMTILLMNNHLYGLTKGQHSPTSVQGQKTKSTPQGVMESPLSPLQLALTAGGTWLGRCFDIDSVLMKRLLNDALDHEGTSLIEVIQNCPVFDQEIYGAMSRDYADHFLMWPGHVAQSCSGRLLSYRQNAWEVGQESIAQIYQPDRTQVWSLLEKSDLPVKGLFYRERQPKLSLPNDLDGDLHSVHRKAWEQLRTWVK